MVQSKKPCKSGKVRSGKNGRCVLIKQSKRKTRRSKSVRKSATKSRRKKVTKKASVRKSPVRRAIRSVKLVYTPTYHSPTPVKNYFKDNWKPYGVYVTFVKKPNPKNTQLIKFMSGYLDETKEGEWYADWYLQAKNKKDIEKYIKKLGQITTRIEVRDLRTDISQQYYYPETGQLVPFKR